LQRRIAPARIFLRGFANKRGVLNVIENVVTPRVHCRAGHSAGRVREQFNDGRHWVGRFREHRLNRHVGQQPRRLELDPCDRRRVDAEIRLSRHGQLSHCHE
jgi:hypothetical protein